MPKDVSGGESKAPMKLQPLPESFYLPTGDKVARELLGHFVIRNTPEGICGGAIVETEAYLTDDPACHGFGRQTPRNKPLYGPPGRAYVYFIYGNHWCFNTVCCPAGVAEAVLVRGIEPLFGTDLMRKARSVEKEIQLTNGPAKLCEALRITGQLNGVELWQNDSPVYVARNPELKEYLKTRGPVMVSTRVGITKAAELPLRFYLGESPYVSRWMSGGTTPGARKRPPASDNIARLRRPKSRLG
jgi:DNA-3-methyladenine glycosylase